MLRIQSKSSTITRTEAETDMNPDRFLVLIIGRDSKLETASIIARLVDRIGDLEDVVRLAHGFNPLSADLASWLAVRSRLGKVLEDRSVDAKLN